MSSEAKSDAKPTSVASATVHVVGCPAVDDSDLKLEGKSVFLAGGISNCPDWQNELIEMIRKRGKCNGVVLYNPRRYDAFDVKDTTQTEFQIKWEHERLTRASLVLFWFPEQSICPITLYELGSWSRAVPQKPLVVGVHPKYSRLLDVRIQTRLARPDVNVVDSLSLLVEQLEAWFQS